MVCNRVFAKSLFSLSRAIIPACGKPYIPFLISAIIWMFTIKGSKLYCSIISSGIFFLEFSYARAYLLVYPIIVLNINCCVRGIYVGYYTI